MENRAAEITRVLDALEKGDERAGEDLLPLIYDELRRRAGQLMAAERRDHTLQRTALVHEAYLRLVKPGATYGSRLHFFNAAGLAMRRILIDHASAKNARKRGGAHHEVSLDAVDKPSEGNIVDVIALDDALERLKSRSPRQAQVVNLRFYAGLKDAEIAELLGVGEKTVRRDWAAARVWLYDQVHA
ncbi:MAG TPA: ECF-type sigma factor [Tepidisphaeraceae bacterium]|jgi:RNA polymerase sigma factor (TIGR02999 family)|nr:ECF-type sigma factor [Tepidisphaeraceae bacterium]